MKLCAVDHGLEALIHAGGFEERYHLEDMPVDSLYNTRAAKTLDFHTAFRQGRKQGPRHCLVIAVVDSQQLALSVSQSANNQSQAAFKPELGSR